MQNYIARLSDFQFNFACAQVKFIFYKMYTFSQGFFSP